jgi:hypothetical protein
MGVLADFGGIKACETGGNRLCTIAGIRVDRNNFQA